MFTTARAALVYTGPARDAIMAFKLGGERRAGRWLSAQMAPLLRHDARLLTFVPSGKQGMRERGFNPAEVLARGIGRIAGVPVRAPLVRRRQTADLGGMDKAGRETALAHAFGARSVPKDVVLVDDLLTTGATANACAQALRDAGAEDVHVITLARTLNWG